MILLVYRCHLQHTSVQAACRASTTKPQSSMVLHGYLGWFTSLPACARSSEEDDIGTPSQGVRFAYDYLSSDTVDFTSIVCVAFLHLDQSRIKQGAFVNLPMLRWKSQLRPLER